MQRVNGNPMVSDEDTIRQMDFEAACRIFVRAEEDFNRCDARKNSPGFDVCRWFDLLDARYEAEKTVWKMFTAGDRSLVSGNLYLKFRDLLFQGGSLKHNA